ncbi:tail assembly protein [Serratia sp. JSRIV004]|uniref:tail assembly protein n=1 Tax=Serratia sp. JSRIV004 TaxID=2831895 RepID=UPI00353031DE|nr:tail assembly protein [Serratia sp. JSRIV004]
MAFIDVPMRKMIFHGPLIERFGRDFKYKAHNVPKMISAAKSLLDGFERYMAEAHKRGLTFAVFVGNERKRNIAEAELEMTKGSEDIHLVPVIIGSKRAGLFQTILGVALISAALFTPAGVLAAAGLSAGTLGMVGASMALGGLVQMLSPQAGGLRMRESPDNKPSYAFGGPVNTIAQGNPVAVGYGCREIGGAVISAGIYTEDQQ